MKNKLLQKYMARQNLAYLTPYTKLLLFFIKTKTKQDNDIANFAEFLRFIKKEIPQVDLSNFFEDIYGYELQQLTLSFIHESIDAKIFNRPFMFLEQVFRFQAKLLHSISEPASTIVRLPNGNLLTGSCKITKDGLLYGNIILRDKNGKRLKVISDDPTSSIHLLEHHMITGTYFNYNNAGRGRMYLRNIDGTIIDDNLPWTTSNDNYSQVEMLADGTMLAVCGGVIKHLKNNKAEDILKLNDPINCFLREKGSLITGNCKTGSQGIHGAINFYNVELVGRPIIPKFKISKEDTKNNTVNFIQHAVNMYLLDVAFKACILIHKNKNNLIRDRGDLFLPLDIYFLIYEYVFPFPKAIHKTIIDRYSFPLQQLKEQRAATHFAHTITNLKMFKPKQISTIHNNPAIGVQKLS